MVPHYTSARLFPTLSSSLKTMTDARFPLDLFCRSMVRFLEAIEYDDNNYSTRDERAKVLRDVYLKTMGFFYQPVPRATLKHVDPARILAAARTCSIYSVYCMPLTGREVQVGTAIYFAILALLDDETDADPSAQMTSFWDDLLRAGGQQQQFQHIYWILLGEMLPDFLSRFGSFCAFNIMRSTFDYFQGCWMEQPRFTGPRGADAYPLFLRHLNGLGGSCIGALFPAAAFDESRLFNDISVVMAQMNGPVPLINDLISFYKEWDRDEPNLVSNWCAVDGIAMEAALERLTDQTIHSCVQLLRVLAERGDAQVLDTVRAFLHGYVTFHVCDPRYRLDDACEAAAESDGLVDGPKFRHYYEMITGVGCIDLDWTMPPETLQLDVDTLHSEGEFCNDDLCTGEIMVR
ncbi:hypothetical protein SLS55_000001 [Diplodia seriata]|uniref:Trichodiene synthase n=1 Tax=Diplodia seriata TaxID=420778 RepID=A0ABR3CT20_9PEZI